MAMKRGVLLATIIKEFTLEVLTRSTNFDEIKIKVPSVNRPGLQLVGYYDYFDNHRVQLLGKAEYSYMQTMTPEERHTFFDSLFSRPIPALVIARNLELFPECIQTAKKRDCTVLRTNQVTGEFMSDLTASLRGHLSPRITRHGVLMEVYGEGVLLMGESGIGKSETAIDLIKHGHRLIADDAVDIQKISQSSLMGSSPELIRYYVEMRGIGVIDVRNLFGVSAVKESQKIDLIVNLEQWRDNCAYDRLGLDDTYTSLLDVQVPTVTIPVKPGRNLAIIIEVAAMNNRQKKLGFNAARTFTERIDAHFHVDHSEGKGHQGS